jgi:hypothetical protein
MTSDGSGSSADIGYVYRIDVPSVPAILGSLPAILKIPA